MTASQHTIAGTVLTMPVKIRKAEQHMAMFSVKADAAQQMIDYSGLKVCQFLPGRAVVVLMLFAPVRWVSLPVMDDRRRDFSIASHDRSVTHTAGEMLERAGWL